VGESSNEPLRGTIDLLILRTLSLAPLHGWGITQRIQQVTDGVLEVNQGSLYPALQRLEQKEWIDSEWRVTDNNRRAKYYRLTALGRRELEGETQYWRRVASAVTRVMATT
jgi:PadR family transcriptional regulator